MILIYILLILLCILFLLAACILFIPFDYTLKAVSLDEKFIAFDVFWFFGLFGYTGEYALNRGFSGSARIFGFKTGGSRKRKDTGKGEKTKKKSDRKRKHRRRVLSAEGIKYIAVHFKKAVGHILPNRFEGYGRLGFADPYDTWLAYSIIETIRGYRAEKLNINYVFEDEVYEGEIIMEGRVFIVYLVYLAVRLLLNKSARKMILN